MNVDGPESPEPQVEPQCFKPNLNDNKSPINATHIDYDETKLSEKCKELLKILENCNNTDNNEKIQIAILMHNFYENNLYVQIKIFDFYASTRQLDLTCSLFNKLIKFYSFTDTELFDKHLKNVAYSLINKHFNINLNDNSDTDSVQFYFNVFKMQPTRTQEKYIVCMLDKLRSIFSFSKLNTDSKFSDFNLLLKETYAYFLSNEDNFFLMKFLIQMYPKNIPLYGVQLIDSLLHIEKQLVIQIYQHQQTDDTDLFNKRSLNLFRKAAVIDLISEFIGLTEKLENKNFYRFIEKSLEFFCKLSLYHLDAVHLGADSFMFKFENVDLFKVLFEPYFNGL
jgi:hypothetical protein